MPSLRLTLWPSFFTIIDMSQCRLCQTERERREFYANRRVCIPCYVKRNAEWQARNPERVKAYTQKQAKKPKKPKPFRLKRTTKETPRFLLSRSLASGFNRALKIGGMVLEGYYLNYLGCTLQEALEHLEKQFKAKMNWDSFGTYRIGKPMTWHIDHIKPMVEFSFTKESDFQECFHYTNFQPLWAMENMSKSGNWGGTNARRVKRTELSPANTVSTGPRMNEVSELPTSENDLAA